MTVPSRTTLVIAAALAVVMLCAVVYPVLIAVVLASDALLVLICLAQGRGLSRLPVTVRRDQWTHLELDRQTELAFRVRNLAHRTVTIAIRQPWPPSFKAESNLLDVTVEAGQETVVAVAVTAGRRGRVAIAPFQIDIRFPTNMARWRTTHDDQTVLTVYPNLQAIAHYDVLRRHHALGRLGIHQTRMVGSGREFDQLREYLPDDNYGDVNWKATARRRQLVTNVYRSERSQDVILCLDCGRMMGNPLATGTVLDQAIDASSMLTHVCTRWGDHVGLVLFQDTVTCYIKPTGTGRATGRIMQELVNATPQGVFPSYSKLVSAVRTAQKRRGMIFVFTDLNDPQLAANLTSVLPLISRRHVVVVISLRDPMLGRVASGPATDRQDVCRILAARHLANERATRIRELVKANVQVLEVDADSITIDVINTYMAIKMRQLV